MLCPQRSHLLTLQLVLAGSHPGLCLLAFLPCFLCTSRHHSSIPRQPSAKKKKGPLLNTNISTFTQVFRFRMWARVTPRVKGRAASPLTRKRRKQETPFILGAGDPENTHCLTMASKGKLPCGIA